MQRATPRRKRPASLTLRGSAKKRRIRLEEVSTAEKELRRAAVATRQRRSRDSALQERRAAEAARKRRRMETATADEKEELLAAKAASQQASRSQETEQEVAARRCADAERQKRQRQEARATAAEAIDRTHHQLKLQKTTPTPEQLQGFEHDYLAGVAMFWEMTGALRYDAEGHSIDQAGPEVQAKLLQQLKEQVLTTEDIAAHLEDYNRIVDPTSPLKVCFACGVCDFEKGVLKKDWVKRFSSVSFAKLLVLQVPAEKLELVNQSPYPESFTVHRHGDTAFFGYAGGVDADQPDHAILCQHCVGAAKGFLPRYAVASGFDFGRPDKLGLQPLSWLEKIVLSKSRPYCHILKLVGPAAGAWLASACIWKRIAHTYMQLEKPRSNERFRVTSL